jgi:Tetratricopeptide repeat.
MDEGPYDEWELTEEDQAYFDKLKNVLVETKVAEYLTKHTKPLVNEEVLVQRFQTEINSHIDRTYSLVQLGYFSLMQGIQELYPEMDPQDAENVKNELDRWTGILVDLGPYSEFLQRVIQSKKNLQEAFYLSNDTVAWFYQVGRLYLHLKKFDQAAGVFYLLIQLNPEIYEFWVGLAACYHEQKLYDDAIAAYKKAKALKADDPTFDLFMAECFFELQNRQDAQNHLQSAHELLKHVAIQDHPLKAKAEFLTNQLRG